MIKHGQMIDIGLKPRFLSVNHALLIPDLTSCGCEWARTDFVTLNDHHQHGNKLHKASSENCRFASIAVSSSRRRMQSDIEPPRVYLREPKKLTLSATKCRRKTSNKTHIQNTDKVTMQCKQWNLHLSTPFHVPIFQLLTHISLLRTLIRNTKTTTWTVPLDGERFAFVLFWRSALGPTSTSISKPHWTRGYVLHRK